MLEKEFDIKPLHTWINLNGKPLVISGPCSAESETQVLETAKNISEIPMVKVFRSGLWKPRTRPHYFEGVGEEGLEWLKKAKKETGLLLAVEVAKPQHVELCLKSGIDILWLGARTVVNPFSVKEITDELKGVDIPVMIKNPVSPDLKLWIGAIERVHNTGIDRIIAIHRGFYTLNKTLFRNPPMWELPIELKRKIPDLPVITDPSHICGNRNMLQHIAQKAMDLEMDGLMIESHYKPLSALTDVDQQISPEALRSLLTDLAIRDKKGNPDFQRNLNELRESVDEIDEEIIELLSKRLELVKKMAVFKKDHNITILQIKRWNEVFNERVKKGTIKGISKNFLLKMLKLLHEESIRIQNEIMNK